MQSSRFAWRSGLIGVDIRSVQQTAEVGTGSSRGGVVESLIQVDKAISE